MQENRGRPRKELREVEKIWLIEFLNRSDVSYTNPGREDHMYIGKVEGKRKYKQNQYILWPLREILFIANCAEIDEESFGLKFSKKLTFSKLYDFLKAHKEYVYKINIPRESCFC